MIGKALLLLVFWGCAAFVVYRLWWSIQNQTIQIKGFTFRRAENPRHYWIYLTSNLIAALMLSVLAAFYTVVFIAWM